MPKIDYASTSLGNEALDAEFEAALEHVRTSEPVIETALIDGVAETSNDVVERYDPVVTDRRVAAAYVASDEQVERAVAAARGAAGEWRRMPYAKRNELLMKGRAAVEENLTLIAAVVSAETGKSRLEAYGEAQEVLDMVEHYTTLFARHDGYRTQQRSTATETNLDVLVPYGTFAVIAPFNFPIALAIGMSSAALVAGNTIVVKPSDKTPRSTSMLMKLFASHLPQGVINIVQGGAQVGQKLAESDVDGIAFTGSAKVGWALADARGPRNLPRPLLAEMGGQNPAIVSAQANLDDAATGIVRSAFGLSGQKCSACRRVIVDERVADTLAAKIVERAEALVVGDPIDRGTNLGPVIDDDIAGRIDAALEIARNDGKVLTGGRLARDGNFFSPIVVADLPTGHPLTREELFAPFLTITRVADFGSAIAEANAVSYGLSAGVYSLDQDEVDRFYDEIEAGVTYSNRSAGATTGAWPGVQSFCGWKLSGSTGKGGLGVNYLQGFMREQNRSIVSIG